MGKLTLEEKIEEIKKLLDEQEDSGLLDEIYERLQPQYDPETLQMLKKSIARAEEDIKHGRVYTPEQAMERLDNFFKK